MRKSFDLPLFVFSDAYALLGFAVSGVLLIAVPAAAGAAHPYLSMACAVIGIGTLSAAVASHSKRWLRQRVYRLLDRRIRTCGFRQEHFQDLCAGHCLRFQHRLLFLRHGVHSSYRPTMSRYRSASLFYLDHPDPAVADALNFGMFRSAVAAPPRTIAAQTAQ